MSHSLSPKEISQLLPTAALRRSFYRAADPEGGAASLGPAAVRAGLTALGHVYQPQTVAFINLKGGVGKTTASLALAVRAAQYGYRAALLDLDSQASATLALNVKAGDDTAIFLDVWQKPAELAPAALLPAAEQLHLLPSALENGLLESSLANPADQKNAVSQVARALLDQGFDLLVLDCPPSLGTAVISAICAADVIIIPLSCDDFSYRGMELTLGEVRSIRSTFGLPTPGLAVLPTGVDRRVKLWDAIRDRLESEHPGLALPLYIRTSSEFSRALAERRGIFDNPPASPARQDYDAFARLMLGLNFSGKEAGHGAG